MHQPDYRHPETGEILLPWVRFHAVKDYYDMAALAEQIPEIRITINIVPSLIDQLTEYASGKAREKYAVLTLRDVSQLAEGDKSFLLQRFFQLPPKHMLLPYPRYRELMELRGVLDSNGVHCALKRFKDSDYRDLQTWYNLTWCGMQLRHDPEIAGLFERGRGFSEYDKKRLLEIQYSFIGRILPFYRTLSESKRIEFSVSPYYHPILPLLCDVSSARQAEPSLTLPGAPFAFPQDAREQVKSALRAFANVFGHQTYGMWPSEGAISDEVLAIAKDEGIRWLASDEAVLSNSIQKSGGGNMPLTPERKFCAYRWGSGQAGPCLFFREHTLSDLIGFSYNQWTAADAVADFLGRLEAIYQSLPDNGRHYIVPVILDGENAWEHYPNNGADFLLLLYKRLTECSHLRTVTFSEFLDLEPHRETLDSIVPGSWIYGNLATWIGHPAKNRAWEELSAARHFLESARSASRPTRLEAAFREIMIAEGSDWFWWYGDDHPTENAAVFDALFRGHLKNAYRLLDRLPPPGLDQPISTRKDA